MAIDKLFRVMAVNPCSGRVHTEEDGIFVPANHRGVLQMLDAYRAKCEKLGAGAEHVHSVELLTQRVAQYQMGILPAGEVVDRKYKILAVQVGTRSIYDETSGLFFSASDQALPAALEALRQLFINLAALEEKPDTFHLESFSDMLNDVIRFQAEVRSKLPDTNTECEIRRCIGGEGLRPGSK